MAWQSACASKGRPQPLRCSLPRAIQLVWRRKSASRCFVAKAIPRTVTATMVLAASGGKDGMALIAESLMEEG